LRGNVACLSNVVPVNHQAAADGPSYFSARNQYAAKVLGAIVIGNKVNELAVWRKMRLRAHSIELLSENFGLASAYRDYREVPGAIFEL
jgi:hypothetical protein